MKEAGKESFLEFLRIFCDKKVTKPKFTALMGYLYIHIVLNVIMMKLQWFIDNRRKQIRFVQVSYSERKVKLEESLITTVF